MKRGQHQTWLSFGGLLLIFFAALAPAAASAATFTATLDRDSVVVGESAILSLNFEGGEPDNLPAIPAIPNLRVSGGGTSRTVTADVVGGSVSSSISQTYSLTPLAAGKYSIPSLKAQVGGQVLTSEPIVLEAVKAGTSSGTRAEPLAFLRLVVPKKEVFVGEALAIETQACIRNGIANAEEILAAFDRYTGAPIKGEGVSILKTVHAQRRQVRIGSGLYSVATIVASITPVKPGQLTLASIEAPVVVQIPLPGQRRRDPFLDPFGMFQQYDQRNVLLVAEPETVNVLPLPKNNVPPTFTGAVGSYTLATSAGPTNVAPGDPITLRIQISGRGPLDAIKLPETDTGPAFKSYPPTEKVETTDPLGLEGRKVFERVLTPTRSDVAALPAVEFSFFDAEQKTYRTLTQPGIALVVRAGGAVPTPTVAAAVRGNQDQAAPAQDIVPIKQRVGTLAQVQPPLFRQGWFLALQLVPLLALVTSVLLRKRAEALANNPRLRRKLRTDEIVRRGLQELRALAAEHKSDEFFGTHFRLLQERLGERLDLPASAITEAVIEEHLRPRGVPSEVLAPLQELFQACNQARYAPVRSKHELDAYIPRLESSLKQLEKLAL